MLCQQICLFSLPLLLAFELVLVVSTGKSEGCVSSFYPHTHLTPTPLLPGEESPFVCTVASTVLPSLDPARS